MGTLGAVAIKDVCVLLYVTNAVTRGSSGAREEAGMIASHVSAEFSHFLVDYCYIPR